MKKIKKKNKRIYLFFIIIIVVSLICYKNFINKDFLVIDNHKYQGTIKNNTSVKLDSNIESLIIDFFNTYYRSMKELKVFDMKKYYSSSSNDEYLLNQTALEVLVSSRKKQLNDLSLKKAKYDITYTNIKQNNNITHIELKENSYIDFKFMDSTSKIYNIINKFDIIKENNRYKIKSFYKEQGQFVMVEELLDNKDYSDIKNYYDKIFDEKLELQKKEYEDYLNNQNKVFKKCDNSFDREKAILYASKHVINRDHTDYSVYGGNCQNYASWSLFEGGIPMDNNGSYKWKYYSDIVDESTKKTGRSSSWTGVNQFYNYAKNNEGYGLCSEVLDNTYYAQKADIIQVGYKDIYSHTTIVVANVLKDGKVIDILLNSNTADHENYPLSAYVYPNKRLIKILGWNN